ncbi:MAG: DUF1566 domain-containing protein [Desulfobacterales bacterium]
MGNNRRKLKKYILLFFVLCVLDFGLTNEVKSKEKNRSIAIKNLVFPLISLFFVISCIHVQPFYANEDTPLSASQNDDELAAIVNPFNSTCYDWRENIIPCDFKGPYAELMFDKSLSDGSFAGDWRLPTMKELCTLIDFSKRDPALPNGHMFSDTPSGYHWSAHRFPEG